MTPRRWNSFVCPGCRMVFRIPRDHDGRGTVCPSCHVLLKIPTQNADLPPLVAPQPEPLPPEEPLEPPTSDSSEQNPGEASPWRLLAGLTTGGIAALVAFWIWIRPDPAATEPPNSVVSLPTPPPPTTTPPTETSANTSVPASFDANKTLKVIEPLVRKFLEATTVEEALTYVHKPDVVRQRWQKHLERTQTTYTPPGCNNVDYNLMVTQNAHWVSTLVTTKDFSMRPIAIRMLSDGPKIDWESWIAWSDYSWEELRAKRPSESFVLRAYLSTSNYYNFNFSDESLWSSYLLESGDNSNSIYGYAKASSSLDLEIRPDRGQSRVPVLLRVRFPENAPSDNQVLIESVGSMGWLNDQDSP